MMPPARVQGVKERRREEGGRRGKGGKYGRGRTQQKGMESTGKWNWYYVYDKLNNVREIEWKKKENEAKTTLPTKKYNKRLELM